MKNLNKKGVELAITKLIVMLICVVFLIVAIWILFIVRREGISVLDAIRDLFIFGA